MQSKRKINNIDMIYVIYIICIFLSVGFTDNMSIPLLLILIISVTTSVSSMAFILFQRLVNAEWSTQIEQIAKFTAKSIYFSILIIFYYVFLYLIDYNSNESSSLFTDTGINKFNNSFLNYYYSPLFLSIRMLLYYTVWLFVLYRINRDCIKSGLYLTIVLFCLSFFGIDVILGVGGLFTDFFWYSSVFGLYFIFTGLVSTIAYIIIIYLSTTKKHDEVVKNNLGKILFAVNLLWAYIAFSQYLIISYGNLPVELSFYEIRFNNNWEYISWFIFLFHFVIPFIFLLPKKLKISSKILFASSLMISISFVIEIYWLVYPIYYPTYQKFSFDEIYVLLMILPIFIISPWMKLYAKRQKVKL